MWEMSHLELYRSFSLNGINTFVIYNYCRLSLLKCFSLDTYFAEGEEKHLYCDINILMGKSPPPYSSSGFQSRRTAVMWCNTSSSSSPFWDWKCSSSHFNLTSFTHSGFWLPTLHKRSLLQFWPTCLSTNDSHRAQPTNYCSANR